MRLTRREVLATLGVLGVGAVTPACRSVTEPRADPDGTGAVRSVIVVGAGAAGLTAAHLLTRRGVDVTILEASSFHGGRMKHDAGWLDITVPLGAEWLHVDRGVLDEIVDDPTIEVTTRFVAYESTDVLGVYDGALTFGPLVDPDLVFVDSSWLDVFDEHVVPGLADRLRLDRPVAEIDHSGARVVVTEVGGDVHECDAVIVTVPPTILRDGDITFRPGLPAPLHDALGVVDIWGGLKAFIQFDDRFYPTALVFPDSFTDAGQYLYYDAAHGQNTSTNLLGLFAVGEPADRYRAASEDQMIQGILAELDVIFDGAASRSALSYRTQDWNREQFIRQAYVADSNPSRLVRPLGRPVAGRVLLAGDSYADGDDWGAVHVAVRSARAAAERLIDT